MISTRLKLRPLGMAFECSMFDVAALYFIELYFLYL